MFVCPPDWEETQQILLVLVSFKRNHPAARLNLAKEMHLLQTPGIWIPSRWKNPKEIHYPGSTRTLHTQGWCPRSPHPHFSRVTLVISGSQLRTRCFPKLESKSSRSDPKLWNWVDTCFPQLRSSVSSASTWWTEEVVPFEFHVLGVQPSEKCDKNLWQHVHLLGTNSGRKQAGLMPKLRPQHFGVLNSPWSWICFMYF